jgi:pimeloyl-ACP methyl ester carboxylesterase
VRRPPLTVLALLVVLAGSRTGASPTVATATAPDGVRIAYATDGTRRPALVFVHGWSCDRRYWSLQLQGFLKYYQVVGLDLAGHGESGSNRQQWTMAAFGGDVAAVVETLKLDKVVLIGHSMGGDVIAEAARRLKGRVAGLIWVDTYKRLGTPRTDDELAAIMRPFRANFAETTKQFVRGMFLPAADPALVAMVVDDMSSAPAEVGIGALESALRYDREMPSALAELKLPVIAINPEAPATDVASMSKHGVEVIVMSDVGHFPMLEAPDRFNRLLRTAVEKIAR